MTRYCVLLLLCLWGFLGYSQPTGNAINWPELTQQTKPWSRWWWMGSSVDPANLSAAMETYQKAGIGGLEITPIYGVRGYEDKFINYLSPEWMAMLDHVLQESARLNLGIDMANGTGWPFGGGRTEAEDAAKYVAFKTYTLQSGQRLEEPVQYIQRPMVRAIGQRLSINDLHQPIYDNENLQALALEQVRFKKPLPLLALMAYSKQGQILNLTNRVDPENRLDWTAPQGEWTLYAVFQGWHGKMVERAAPGGEGNVIDHFSREALQNYLQTFDAAFAGRNISDLRGFFNDSYEVDDAAGEANWTPKFFEAFAARRRYDLRHHLPLLFAESPSEEARRVRSDYRETVSDLLLEEFTRPWRQWAETHDAIIRNQAHGSPANILDLYAASDIPETEGSDRIRFKTASSAAHVTGKQLVAAEASTWLDEHFLATLADVKHNVDRYFLGGVNHIVYHGTTYSPQDEPWPGWMFYASVHFGPTNTFWPDFHALNDYVARTQAFLQTGQPDNDLLLYFPIYDRWSEMGRSLLTHFDGAVESTSARPAAEALLASGYTFDFISDKQLQAVSFQHGALQTGGSAYQSVLVPSVRFLPLATIQKLITLAQNGASVLVQQPMRWDVPGLGNLAERQEQLQRLLSELTFFETDTNGIQKATVGEGTIWLGGEINSLLSAAGLQRESMVEQNLAFVRRKTDGGRIYFIVNRGDEAYDGWVRLCDAASAAAIFDPMRSRKGLAAYRSSGRGENAVYLQLAAGESCMVRTYETSPSGERFPYTQVSGEERPVEGTWSVTFTQGGPVLPEPRQVRQFTSWTEFDDEAQWFSGSAEYHLTFSKPKVEAEGWRLNLGAVFDSAQVFLNGELLATLIAPPFQVAFPSSRLKAEENQLTVRVSNRMANRIAALDRRTDDWKKFYNINFPPRRRENRGENGLFTAEHWPARDSGLVGPVTLTPVSWGIPDK